MCPPPPSPPSRLPLPIRIQWSAWCGASPAALPPRAMIDAILPLLGDPVRSVRVETARVIAGIDPQTMTPEQRGAFSSAYQELVSAELIDADRPETHLNLGLLKTRRQQLSEAEAEYRTALRLDPKFVPAMANLADLDRQRGQDKEGAELLRTAIAIEPNNAAIKHSLGLLLVRQRNYDGSPATIARGRRARPRQCALCLCLCRRSQLHRLSRRGEDTSRKEPTSSIRRTETFCWD